MDYYKPDRLQSVGRRTDPYLLIGEHLGSGEVDIGQYDSNRDLDFIDDVFLSLNEVVINKRLKYNILFRNEH